MIVFFYGSLPHEEKKKKKRKKLNNYQEFWATDQNGRFTILVVFDDSNVNEACPKKTR